MISLWRGFFQIINVKYSLWRGFSPHCQKENKYTFLEWFVSKFDIAKIRNEVIK